jgi:NADH:ubiquinone oxidoreductase subunit F (NADH-binding)/Pyruvate/2-oxoacid:ferredoxin oxidoreductase delta subunit
MENGYHVAMQKFLTREILTNQLEPPSKEELEMLSFFRHERIPKPILFIGSATCGKVSGADKLYTEIKDYLDLYKIDAIIREVGCVGLCSMEPLLDIQLPGKTRVSFARVNSGNLTDILDGIFNSTILHEHVLGQYQSAILEPWAQTPFINDLRFFKNQKRIILKNCGIISPGIIEEYISRDGYRTFLKTIRTYSPDNVCSIIEDSGLRGRGGSGYLTGQKWKAAYNTADDQKYLICNADESDPGAFMDRAIMESDPHSVIEGIAIASYAIGASKAMLFMREEYTLARSRIQTALNQAREFGILGEDIFKSGFNLTITIRTAPGAFILGEETALIACLEGKRANPRQKPPYPSQSGFLKKPTVVNNLKTLANVPNIMQNGPQWYRSVGTEDSKGTKVLCLTGKTVNKGFVEVPMGTSFNDIIYTIGGGIADNLAFKALHIGGPLGTVLTEDKLGTTIDFESLKKIGANMGSGGLVVLDSNNCVLDLVRFYMEFLQHESCGKCIPCREGNRRMTEILTNITQRAVRESSHETLERFKGIMQLEGLAEVIKETSQCGLGKNAPNPVLSILQNFRTEVEEHIFDRYCRANVCKELRVFYIDIDKCTGCTACAKKCPTNAIIGTPTNPHFIVEAKCTGCGICYETCKFVAINIK